LASNGVFRLAPVPPGVYDMVVVEGWLTRAVQRAVEVTEGAAPTLDFTVPEARGVVTGRVLGAENGAPLAGAVVTLENDLLWRNTFRTQTDAEGRYVLRGVPPGRYTVLCGALDRANRRREGVAVSNAAPTTDVDFRLPVGGTIIGRVFGPDGQPLAYAQVATYSQDRPPRPTGPTEAAETTDAEGRFRLEHLAAGEYELHVTAPGCQSQSWEAAVKEGEALSLADVMLKKADEL
jgi:protocatechuate 3,4-dioxygenase beta subunit